MALSSPSYLFKNRFGIYYFRCRIPDDIRNTYHINKIEIRKSLGTKNYRDALQRARRVWVQMVDSDYMQKLREIDRGSEEIDEGERLLSIFNEIQQNGFKEELDVFVMNLTQEGKGVLYDAYMREKNKKGNIKIQQEKEKQKEISGIAEQTAKLLMVMSGDMKQPAPSAANINLTAIFA
jgi:hypothetical protein